jgi:uncharacterized protein YdcH (DUF465 family)
MENDPRTQIESLARVNEELRGLWEEHQSLERQLATLETRAYLTPEEQVERSRIKKRKLATKDRIAGILARSGG